MPRRRRLPRPRIARRDGRRPARVGTREIEEAGKLLAVASREGRFGASALHEERLASLEGVSTGAELGALLDDLADLVPEPVREKALEVLREAHAQGRLSLEELLERTDRCLGPLRVTEADELVSEFGYRVEQSGESPRRGRALASLLAAPVAGGLVLGGLVAAAPASLGVGVAPWLPLAAAVGISAAVFSLAARVAWTMRARSARTSAAGEHRPECVGQEEQLAGVRNAHATPAPRLSGDP